MWNIVFRKLFRRKMELLILGVVVIACAISTKVISIDYWESLDWQVTGYHPWIPAIVMLWMTAYMAVLHIRRIHAISLWIMGISGFAYGVIMGWMVWQ